MHKSTTNLRPLVPSHSSKCTCTAVQCVLTYTFFIREPMNVYYFSWYYREIQNGLRDEYSPFTFRFIAFTHSGMHVCISSCSFTAHLIITFPVCISYLLDDNNDGKWRKGGKLQSYMHSQTLILFTIFILLDPLAFKTKWELASQKLLEEKKSKIPSYYPADR